mgnify:FL=1
MYGERCFAVVVGIPFIAIGVCLFVEGLRVFGTAFAYRNWTKTDAVVTSVFNHKKGTNVHYTYTVNGMKYSASEISFSPGLRKGKPTVAYYNPNDPGQSRLLNYVRPDDFLLFPFGYLFFFVGMKLLYHNLFTSGSEPAA